MHQLGFLLLGFSAATLGSMVGMGGGSFIAPCLLIFWAMDPVQAVAISLVAVLAGSTSSVISHLKAGGIDVRNGPAFSGFAVLGALAGAMVLFAIKVGHYPLVLGLFLLCTGLAVWMRKDGGFIALDQRIALAQDYFKGRLSISRVKKAGGVELLLPVKLSVGYGLSMLAGMGSTIFGVGGGSILTPGLIFFLHYPAKIAIATAQIVMAAGAAAGLGVILARGQALTFDALWIALGAWAGGSLGSKISRLASEIFLSRLLGSVLVITGLRLLWQFFAAW